MTLARKLANVFCRFLSNYGRSVNQAKYLSGQSVTLSGQTGLIYERLQPQEYLPQVNVSHAAPPLIVSSVSLSRGSSWRTLIKNLPIVVGFRVEIELIVRFYRGRLLVVGVLFDESFVGVAEGGGDSDVA